LLQQYGYQDDPIFVHWHLRTGDLSVIIDVSQFLFLKGTIDAHIKHRKVVHHVFTQNSTQGLILLAQASKNKAAINIFRSHFKLIDKHDMENVLKQLLAAHIVVSLGSSTNYMVPLLKKHENYVHFFFPPKETLTKRNGGSFRITSLKGMQQVRNNSAYASFFVNKGIVPVFNVANINIIPEEYKYKMETMLDCLDRRVAIPRRVSELSYEGWSTGGPCQKFSPLTADGSPLLCPKPNVTYSDE
jgi:hypothetical protein